MILLFLVERQTQNVPISETKVECFNIFSLVEEDNIDITN